MVAVAALDVHDRRHAAADPPPRPGRLAGGLDRQPHYPAARRDLEVVAAGAAVRALRARAQFFATRQLRLRAQLDRRLGRVLALSGNPRNIHLAWMLDSSAC